MQGKVWKVRDLNASMDSIFNRLQKGGSSTRYFFLIKKSLIGFVTLLSLIRLGISAH